MTELTKLYVEYEALQGDDPIPIGEKLSVRLAEHAYKASTMRQIVGLLRRFTETFEQDTPRNKRYAVGFSFDGGQEDHIPTGPYLVVCDFISDRCVCLMCWDHGDIKTLYGSDTSLTSWGHVCAAAVKELRKWEIMDRDVREGRELWDKVDSERTLSPVATVLRFTEKQVAGFLGVTKTYLRGVVRRETEALPRGGVIAADAAEIVKKVDGAEISGRGAVLPLVNGGKTRVPLGKTYYYTLSAAFQIACKVREAEDYPRAKAAHTRLKKGLQVRENGLDDLHNRYACTWAQLGAGEGLAPIKGLDMVTGRQAADFLGMPPIKMNNLVAKFRKELQALGMVVMSAAAAAGMVEGAKRREDLSYDFPLQNGEYVRISNSRNTFLTAPAVKLLRDLSQND